MKIWILSILISVSCAAILEFNEAQWLVLSRPSNHTISQYPFLIFFIGQNAHYQGPVPSSTVLYGYLLKFQAL